VVPVTPSTNGANGQAGKADRDGSGRFAKGNRGGPGNPFARDVAARRRALLDAIHPTDIANIARELHDLALAGDVAAAKVLLSYVVGRPTEARDPDRLDLDELALHEAVPSLERVKELMINRIAASYAIVLATDCAPASLQEFADWFARQYLAEHKEYPGQFFNDIPAAKKGHP
jgi:hypothetical protein